MNRQNKRRARATGKGNSASFVAFQHRILQHPKFLALSGQATKVLLYLAAQYKGNNNGDLSLAVSLEDMKPGGRRVFGNDYEAARELEEAGFLLRTRQGGRNRCSLYALAWFPIDECGGKHYVPATSVAPNDWMRLPSIAPPAVQSAEQSRQFLFAADSATCTPGSAVPAQTPSETASLHRGRCSQGVNQPSIAPPAVTSVDIPRPEAVSRPFPFQDPSTTRSAVAAGETPTSGTKVDNIHKLIESLPTYSNEDIAKLQSSPDARSPMSSKPGSRSDVQSDRSR